MSWIKVSDRPPMIGNEVLVYARHQVNVAWIDVFTRKFVDVVGPIYEVTHWQPLPAPPEET